MTVSVPPEHFERLHREKADPWGFATREYERAKYDDTLGALEDRRFARGLELGCSIGVLTALLASRCDHLVACDASPTACRATAARVAGTEVDVRVAVIPAELPAGPFDLVVASEVLYYLDAADLARTLDGIERELRPGGTLLAVHWTPRAPTHPQLGDDVHDAIAARPAFQLELHRPRPTYRLDRFRRA